MFTVRTSEVFAQWFGEQSEEVKVEVLALVTLLKEKGPMLSRPYADTLNGSKHRNMKELRGSTATQVLRIAFAFDPERNGILLVAGDKQGINQRLFYTRLISQADDLYDRHLMALQAEQKKRSKK